MTAPATKPFPRATARRRLLRRCALVAAALSLASAGPAMAQINASQGRPVAASVLTSSGDTRLMRPSALLTPLRIGEPIRAGDRVLTGDDGRVQVRFTDGAVVSVQPDSDFKVDEYRYDRGSERSFLSLARGAVRTVTGAIGKRRHDDFRLRTPTATIGVRGTDFETIETLCGPAGCPPGREPGLTVTVYQGRIAVTNETGTTEVPEGATLRVRNRTELPQFVRAEPGRAVGGQAARRGNGTRGNGARGPSAAAAQSPAGGIGAGADLFDRDPLIDGTSAR